MKKKAKKKVVRKQKKFVKNFIQSLHIFPDEMLVSVGTEFPGIVKAAKRLKVKAAFLEGLEKSKRRIEELEKTVDGFFLKIPYANGEHASILWLKDWKHEWYWYEVMMHECYHAIDFLVREGRGAEGEQEALAYAHQYLFAQIRRKLDEGKGTKE